MHISMAQFLRSIYIQIFIYADRRTSDAMDSYFGKCGSPAWKEETSLRTRHRGTRYRSVRGTDDCRNWKNDRHFSLPLESIAPRLSAFFFTGETSIVNNYIATTVNERPISTFTANVASVVRSKLLEAPSLSITKCHLHATACNEDRKMTNVSLPK